MKRSEALALQKELKDFLYKRGIHFKIEHVCKPDLKFINFSEISIKITGDYGPNIEPIRMPANDIGINKY